MKAVLASVAAFAAIGLAFGSGHTEPPRQGILAAAQPRPFTYEPAQGEVLDTPTPGVPFQVPAAPYDPATDILVEVEIQPTFGKYYTYDLENMTSQPRSDLSGYVYQVPKLCAVQGGTYSESTCLVFPLHLSDFYSGDLSPFDGVVGGGPDFYTGPGCATPPPATTGFQSISYGLLQDLDAAHGPHFWRGDGSSVTLWYEPVVWWQGVPGDFWSHSVRHSWRFATYLKSVTIRYHVSTDGDWVADEVWEVSA